MELRGFQLYPAKVGRAGHTKKKLGGTGVRSNDLFTGNNSYFIYLFI